MINYKDIWDSINIESQNNSDKTLIARKISSQGIFPVFLATDFKKGLRLLYIKCDSDLTKENLPTFKGLDITYIIGSLGEYSNQYFLKFYQKNTNNNNIF